MEEKKGIAKLISIIPGLAVMVGTLYVLRMYVEPALKGVDFLGYKDFFVRVLGLNYILLAIFTGMLYRNVVFGGKIPGWAEEGFRTTRLFIKSGVIMLGSLYTLNQLFKMGFLAVALICGFVFGTIFLVMFLGRLFNMERSIIGVMCAACGVCGVSAAVATSPGVRAKPSEVALAIATILGFGILTMFISPMIGRAIGLSDYQFGAWVGTGILNSGQVLATCLAFNPTIAPGTAVAYGEVWNVVRVITIPFVVFLITVWYWREERDAEHVSLTSILMAKFPVFVLGFMAMTILSTLGFLGVEGSSTIKLFREIMSWIFGIGLVGIGAYIDIREIKQAGGAPLKVGLIAGTIKYLLALAVVLLFVAKEASF